MLLDLERFDCYLNFTSLANVWPAYINHLFLEIFYEELKKLSKKLVILSFFHKKFPKMVC